MEDKTEKRVGKVRKVVVVMPVMGGKVKVWGSLRTCCLVLGLSEGSVRRALSKGGKYVNGDYCVYVEDVEFPVRNRVGNAENFKK